MLGKKGLFFCAVTVLISGIGTGSCKRSPQAKEARFLGRGKELLAKKDFGRAILEFQNAAQAMPTDAEPQYQIGQAYLMIRDTRSAAISFRKAIQLDAKHTGAQLKLAEIEANTRNRDLLDAAIMRLQWLLTSAPDNLEAINALAIAEWRLGKADSATKLLEETLQKFPASLRSSISLERLKLRQKDATAAEAILLKAAQSDPKSPLPVLALGQLYIVFNQSEKAASAFHKVLELDPKSEPAVLGLATLELSANHPDQAEKLLRQLASLNQAKYASVHAIFLFQTGKQDAAIEELEKIIKDRPSDRLTRTKLVQAYIQMNKLPQAQDLLSAVLKRNPKDIDALLQRGKLYLRAGKIREAQEDLNQLIHIVPDQIPAHIALADVYRARGLAKSEGQELSEALRLNPALPESRLRMASSLLGDNQAGSAMRLLEDAPEPQKKTLLWNVERNRVLLTLRKTQELRAALDRQLAIVRVPEFVLQDALLKLIEHDYAGARAAAEEVLSQNSEDPTAARVIADAYFAEKQPDKAIERLSQLVAAHPNSAPLQGLIGEWYLRTGNRAAARKAWTAAKTVDAGFLGADVALSELDRQEGHADAARERLLAVLQTAPADVPTLMALARLDEYSDNLAEAIATYRKVLNVDGRNLYALNNLAFHLALDNSDEALKLAQQAAEIAPDDPIVEDTVGWIYYHKGVYGKASTYLKKAFSNDPTPRREFHLAMSFIKAGDEGLGGKMLEAALKKDPSLVKTEKGW